LKRVLISGATGFIGANLCRRLLNEGHEIHCLVRPEYASWRIEAILKDINIHLVNLDDAEKLALTISRIRPEWVFHLATHGAYSWQTDLARIMQTNLMGTIHLVEACIKTGFEVFINTGSSSEYGIKDHAPSEIEWTDPNSYYAVGKASATLYCRYSAKRYHVNIQTVRLYSVFGPFEEPGRLIPNIVINGLNGALPPLVDPEICRDYIYVEDVEDAYLLMAGRSCGENGGIYNLGTGIQISLHQVVDTARRIFNLSVKPQWGTMQKHDWDTKIWKADNTKISRELGWQPNFTFEQGLQNTVDWFQNQPELLQYYQK